MTSDTEIRSFGWCIEDYFKLSAEFVAKGETGVFVSPYGNNMAKIELHIEAKTIVKISISIKTEQFVNLSSVCCYRYREVGRSRKHVKDQNFYGISTEWRLLVVQNQFNQMYPTFQCTSCTLIFEFKFKKHDDIMNRYLLTDIGGHLMNPAFSDTTIKTSEGDELPAHKILLVARSDVFRAQFQHDTVEKSTNTVECAFETNVVKDLLSYIYQDVAPNIEETAFKLLVAADYYQLDRLKEHCGAVLGKKLNVNNAVQLLTLADTHNACKLKKSVLEFITDKSNGDKIVKKEDWTLLSIELVRNIFEYSVSNK